MPLRYVKYRTDVVLCYDLMFVLYRKYTYCISGMNEYLELCLPSLGMFRYLVGPRFHLIRQNVFRKMVSDARDDILKHMATRYYSCFGSFTRYGPLVNNIDSAGMIKWLESVKFRYIPTQKQIHNANAAGIKFILKFTDASPECMLNGGAADIKMSALNHLADVCHSKSARAYETLVRRWCPDKIRLMYSKGFPITSRTLEIAHSYRVDDKLRKIVAAGRDIKVRIR